MKFYFNNPIALDTVPTSSGNAYGFLMSNWPVEWTDVYILHADLSRTLISGYRSALSTFVGPANPIHSVIFTPTWNCPRTSVLPTDKLLLDQWIFQTAAKSNHGEFISPALNKTVLEASTWQYRKCFRMGGSYIYLYFLYGGSTWGGGYPSDSWVDNVKISNPDTAIFLGTNT